MAYRQSLEGCSARAIGEHGLTDEQTKARLARMSAGFDALRAKARDGSFRHFSICAEDADIAQAEAALAALSEGARTLVVLGTGGSSLGGQTLAQLGGWSIPGDGGGPTSEKRPRLRFYDNLDARSFQAGLKLDDLADARFIVISKSGGTAETLAQMLTVMAMLRENGQENAFRRLFLAVSDPRRPGQANGLRDLCEAHGIPVLDNPPEIGGRYAALTVVGLLPLIARGLDARAVRAGAKSVVDALADAAGPSESPPALGAAVSVALAEEKGVNISVMMPYADKLERFAAWYVQLWAESLGKDEKGTTPIAALGPVDQHSQLQLYLGGPRQHMTTILRVAPATGSPALPSDLAHAAGAGYLSGFSIADLVEAQGRAIVDAFVEARRPVRAIDVPVLDERAMGALMMHFMIETILTADLLGVNPFDQPAVEMGKRITREYLARMTPKG
ncbi:MAG: glucose-6-phosphate isomerase [Hyphomicrobiales bacterium]|nr:glucose-6-phosphate isomerase [Hyphomicrobiales bacterium]